MHYHELIRTHAADAEQLERLYQDALQAGADGAFREAIEAERAAAPDNLLYAAWFYRLRQTAGRVKESFTNWGWALPLALATGLVMWLLSDEKRFPIDIGNAQLGMPASPYFPMLMLLATPVAATAVMGYLAAAGRRRRGLATLIAAVLLAAAAYVILFYPRMGTRPYQEQYLTLMAIHLPALAWAGVGVFLLCDHRDARNRFAFLIMSLELFVMGGLFVIAGGIFLGVTVGLFDAIGVTMPDLVQRGLLAGGAGLLPVIVTAVVYNPAAAPAEQAFEEGLSRLVAMLMRILLPLSALVLLIYLAFIPFNFTKPFEDRDVLLVYNAMLFAVIALMVGATPVNLAHLSPRAGRWLRRGIVVLAALAIVVSLYALAAIIYRAAIDRLTPNRLTFIGWNVINIGLLALILFRQARAAGDRWLDELQRAFAAGTLAYAAWTVAVILVLPWLFGIDVAAIERLPLPVQRIAYNQPDPILLKCAGSPHIYLLDDGQKRWIDTIDTFTARGYVWGDVRFIDCGDLRAIPDGEPIPKDAGPPPQPQD